MKHIIPNNINKSSIKYNKMDTPSLEQQTVINDLIDGKNVVVNAVAGSGKSTCVISAAIQMPTHKFLQVTYNASLRTDTMEKITRLNVSNIVIHTYHSLAVSHYHPSAHTDIELRRILRDHMPIIANPFVPDIIVLDETQDMTQLYFAFIAKYIRDINHPIQLLILGDHKQCLYEFKGADMRFLTKAADIWMHCPLLKHSVFEIRQLQTSYRVTNQMAEFVNSVMLGEDRLHAVRNGSPVVYIRNDDNTILRIIIHHIRQLIQKGTKPHEIFVLGASMKSNIRKIENALVNAGIPCYIPSDENIKIDDKVIAGKLVFSTFHSVKGRQRPHVLIYKFDHSYFQYYARTLDTNECPNTMYVGCTRATQNMICLESSNKNTDRPFDFMKMDHITMKEQPYIDFRGNPQTVVWENVQKENEITNHHISPTELIRFVKEDILEEITPIIERIFVCEQPEMNMIETPNIIETQNGLHEDVSDINGVAIPAIYADSIDPNGGVLLYDMIHQMSVDRYPYLKEHVMELTRDKSIDNYLYMANLYIAIQSKLYSKISQINRTEYTWLDGTVINECMERMNRLIDTVGKHEQTIIDYNDDELQSSIINVLNNHPEMHKQFGIVHRFLFSARADMISDTTIWELKCTMMFTPEHFMQIIIYAWIWRTIYKDDKIFKLLNIKTGQIYRLESTYDELTNIVVKLLVGKYGECQSKSDPNFVEACIELL